MRRSGMTIREAAESWVQEMNAFPYDMIEKLMSTDIDSWHEVTTPSVGDRVWADGYGSGTIAKVKVTEDGIMYEIDLDESLLKPVYGDELEAGKRIEQIDASADGIEVERDSSLPMWGTLWQFGDSTDDYWLEEMGGIDLMSRCGFRVYESDDFGYFFGIDGAGYDFYEAHWVPLYKARGLHWHDPMTESGSFVMTERRKAELYSALIGHLDKITLSKWELANVLREIGFSDQEIEFEGLGVIGDVKGKE